MKNCYPHSVKGWKKKWKRQEAYSRLHIQINPSSLQSVLPVNVLQNSDALIPGNQFVNTVTDLQPVIPSIDTLITDQPLDE